jgi:tetratricopeptide (TPR) repeat protein
MTAEDTHTVDAPPAEQLAQIKELIQNAGFDAATARLQSLLETGLEGNDEREALYMLAVSRRYARQPEPAEAALEELLTKYPDYGRAYQERGYLYLALNRPNDATTAFSKAVELNPGLIACWKALVNLHESEGRHDQALYAKGQVDYLTSLPHELLHTLDLIHEGKLYKAEQLCRHYLQNNRHHIEAMRMLADIGIRLKVYDDAEFLLESCVEFAPEHIGARSDYLKILNKKSKFEKAYEQARILFDKQPDNPVFRVALGNALAGLGRFRESIEVYRECLDKKVNRPGVYVLLGHAQKAVGELDDAIDSYREAYRLKPDYGDAFWSLANIKTYQFTESEIAHIRKYESTPGINTDDRIHLCFAAGKAFEDRRDYETSFEYYERGNALKRHSSGYDPDKTDEMVQAQIDVCTRELFEKRSHLGLDSPDPIFIVGLPRAGSTLLEQILASHSLVDATMELHDILGLAQRLRGRTAEKSPRYPRILRELDDSYFRRFGEQYIENTRVYRGSAPYFIDKMPNNFLHIGLIRLILPNAKVIDARRHPLACCFGGFKQLFGEGQDFTYGLEVIGRYYRAYVRLMDHWDAVLPGFVLRVMHEDVVNDLETQVRRILEFCNLPFEESCLEFHKTERSIRTPSSEQVKQPIYRSGLEQWRHYAAHLEPLRAALGPEILERYPEPD